MKNVQKLKKQFVINTNYIEKSTFNEPIYIINSSPNSVFVYNVTKQNKVVEKEITLSEKECEKTFITVKDFFKKCVKDGTEYEIEKVNNGDFYIRVAYLGELSLFYRFGKTNRFILTNINKYKFVKTNRNIQQALNHNANFSYYENEKAIMYLNNLKSIKRDYLYALKNNLNILQKQCLTNTAK